jgi:hypothetical protein
METVQQKQQSLEQFKEAKTGFNAAAAPSAIDPRRQENSNAIKNKLDKARLQEINFKYYGRIIFSVFFGLLLATQNYVIFDLVYTAFDQNVLPDIQMVLGIIVPATLTETYFITKIIIQFIFDKTDYS